MIGNLATRAATATRERPWHSAVAAVVAAAVSIAVLHHAVRQRSLPEVLGWVILGAVVGGLGALLWHQASLGWIQPPPGPLDRATPEARKRVTRAALIGALLLGVGGAGAVAAFVRSLEPGIGVGVAVAVVGVMLVNIWLARSAVTAPFLWTTAGGMAMVAGGAAVLMSSVLGGVVAWLAGLVLFKLGLLPQIDTVIARRGELRPEGAVRRRRATIVVVAGLVGGLASLILALAGLDGRNARLLLVAVMVGVAALSASGLAVTRLTQRRSLTVAVALWVVGAGLGAVGGFLAYRAAGDWFDLALVAWAVLFALGAWFVFRGEGLVALVLVGFVLIWVVHDRDAGSEPAADGARPVVVALGDSFMSGEGAKAFYEGTNTTAADGDQCRRAPTAYAVLVASAVDAELVNVACSGAALDDLTGKGPGADQADLPVSGRDPQLTTVARLNPQVKAQARVVLVSIGGNDTDFGKIVKACLLPTSCADKQDLWIAKAESFETELVAVYQQIQRTLPNATVVVVPYPRYVSAEDCKVAVSGEEYRFVTRFIDALDGTILRAAKSAGVLVADTVDSFAGHQQCDPVPGANVVALAPIAGPVAGRLDPSTWVHNSMHPNEVGHELQAKHLAPVVADLLAGRKPTTGLEDLTSPPGPLTPEERRAELVRLADEQLSGDQWLRDGLTDAARTLLGPMALLVVGGMVAALGCWFAGKPSFLLPPCPTGRGKAREEQRFAVVGLASDDGGARVLVVAPVAVGPPPDVVLTIDGAVAGDAELGPWHRFLGGVDTFWWRKATVPLAESATATVTVRPRDPETGWQESRPAQLAGLPARDATALRLVVGSCYDRTNGPARADLADAYRRACAGDDLGPDATTLHVWLGDQVYLDSPWSQGLRDTDGYELVAEKYLDNWEIGPGREPDVGFGAILRRSSNWFVPDDHEFWNGYPELSYFTLTLHAVRRAVWQLARYFWRKAEPPHPANQGSFGVAAGDGFMVFQTPLDRAGGHTFDDEMSPDQIQRIDLDRLLVLIIDTRWHRTIRNILPGAGFMLPEDLERVVEDLQDERPVVLMTGRPMVGHPPRRSPLGVDLGAEAYVGQATTLYRAVSRRALSGKPTVIVGGDVHQHGMRGALGDSLVEIVSSPMALLNGGEGGSLLGRVVLEVRSKISSALRKKTPETAFPVYADGGGMELDVRGRVHFSASNATSGIGCLAFDLSDRDHPRLRYSFAGSEGPGRPAEIVDLGWTGAAWCHLERQRGSTGDQ